MSNPPNILADFRTYSYHHILIVADGMNTANELSNSSNLLLFNKPNVQPENRWKARFLDGAREKGYVTLIDGMQDVTFFIESVKWETVIAPSGTSGGSKRASTIETDGQITIIEPLGVKFLEVLTNVSNELGTDPSGFIFLLKTVFVGHRDDGNQEVISWVRPFLFTMIDITAVMDTGGTTYNLSLVGVNNGTAKLPQISRIADGINVNIQGGTLLPAALQLLFEEINKRYATFKAKLNKQLQEAKSTVNVTDDFRSLRYEIKVDEEYADYIAANNETITTSTSPEDTILTCGANSTVENYIKKVMESSKGVMEDATKKNKEEKKFLYKIASTLIPDETGDDMVVEYSVHRYEEVTQQPKKSLEPIAGEFIEFEYMFTGKNVDVLEFDIKMDMGMSFFQTVAQASAGLGEQGKSQENEEVVSVSVDDGTVATPPPTARPPNRGEALDPSDTSTTPKESTQNLPQATKKKIKTPLFLGTTVKDPVIRNKRNPLESAAFDALLSRHAAYENVECAMKIAGNPQLLDESTPKSSEVSQGGILSSSDQNSRDNTGLQRIFKTPALVKVNVKFPSNNELTGVDEFWYKGFYNLYTITQNFDGGLFTQDIQMFSLPIEDDFDTTTKLATKAEKTTPDTPPTTFNQTLIDAESGGTPSEAERDALEEAADPQTFTGNQSVKTPGLLEAQFDE